MLDPDDDYLVLAAAKDAMHKAQQARKKEVEDAHNTLKGSTFFSPSPSLSDTSYSSLQDSRISQSISFASPHSPFRRRPRSNSQHILHVPYFSCKEYQRHGGARCQ